MFDGLFVQILNFALNDRNFGILQQTVGVFNSIEIDGIGIVPFRLAQLESASIRLEFHTVKIRVVKTLPDAKEVNYIA